MESESNPPKIDKNITSNKLYNLKFALHDPMHCLTPGLFRSLQKGERRKLKLDICHIFGKDNDIKKIEFKGPEPLGADDLRVLQGLIAIAGNNKNTDFVTNNTTSDAGISLRSSMNLSEEIKDETILVARGSFRELAKEIGWSDYENTKLIQKSVESLHPILFLLVSRKIDTV